MGDGLHFLKGIGQPSLLLRDDRVSKVGVMLLIDILLKMLWRLVNRLILCTRKACGSKLFKVYGAESYMHGWITDL
ncbi:hypothetical protein GOP47_0013359 [Adiantum capillus-veneris]|uniref:Uncharacterized protein n=1 Tax=Adiantum capillus-veneris TaxID=13818 RepID=A0A9D4ZD40_ADICA|nr:hypothetical protein GOP47_0013359 [Adiantum capillus-veneris]